MESTANKVKHLRKSDFFRLAPDPVIEQLASVMEEMEIAAGDAVFSKGETGTALYFLVRGGVRVHDGDLELTTMGEGEVFGEIGAICSELRTASVTASEQCRLLKLEKDSLFEVLNNNPEGALSVIRAMAEREKTMAHHVTDRALKARLLERELEIGRRIQSGFLPESIPQLDGWALNAALDPAREVAGDFYDLFVLEENGLLAIVIGDVCDKGLGAALFMILFRSLLRQNAEAISLAQADSADGFDFSRVTTRILKQSISLTNQYISRTHSSSSMFASVFFGLLDPETGQLAYINAGHESPMITAATAELRHLSTTGPVIGLFPNLDHGVGMEHLQQGEILIGFTDGISEAKNLAAEEYGEERLGDLCRKISHNETNVCDYIMTAVSDFVGSADQHDDMTLVSVQRL